jgi:hypothetical protein
MQYKPVRLASDWLWKLNVNLYLNGPKAILKVPDHFVSAIRSLVNSPPKLCRFDNHVARGTLLTISLEPFDGLIHLLAALKARNFQR